MSLDDVVSPLTLIGVITFNDPWCVQEIRSAKLLWVCEFQEEVKMTNEDSNNSKKASIWHQHVEPEEHPRQVHRLKSGSEPEADDCFFVKLAPHVEDTENHRIHKELKLEID